MTTTAVRVALRVRPLQEQDVDPSLISFIKDEPQICFGNEKRSFTFDFVHKPNDTQEQVYNKSVLPLLDCFTEGKNVTILAYGQTGSGKTYSMGTSLDTCTIPLHQGIIHRFADSLFQRLMENCSESLGKKSFQVYVSFLEVYNEDINDLLGNQQQQDHHHSSLTNDQHHPTIREDVQGNIYWTGIKEEKIDCVNDLIGYLKKGIQCRTTGSTEMNSSSSRSHAIFSIILKQHINDEALVENDRMLNLENVVMPTNKHLVSKFHFVDLAGSERLKRTNALGDRQKEGIFINSGLLALGNVISALGDESRKNGHVPYRDSKLTRLLQDSLGGNSHTLMLACVSPSSLDYTETLNTLKYANRARNIQNRVQVNQYFNEPSEETHHLRMQVARLKIQVAMLKDGKQDQEIEKLQQQVSVIKSYSTKVSNELAQVQSERDSLLLKLGTNIDKNMDPLIQNYVQEIQTLRLQIAETSITNHAVKSNSSSKSFQGREPLLVSSSSMETSTPLFIQDETNNSSNKRLIHHPTSSSSRRLKKRPLFHRMKSTQSTSLPKKKLNEKHYRDMDELLQLLRTEYLFNNDDPHDDLQELIDETHETHASASIAAPAAAAATSETAIDNQTFLSIKMPDTPISTNNLDEDDDLEALTVPSWSDVPTPNFNTSSKRKSISLDSMWDDTDSSMTTTTTSRTPHQRIPIKTKSKDMKRQSKSLLKMLHQIQADILVKRELVGQLEKSEDQYTQMRVNYEERLNELKDHLLELQNQRDAALKKAGTTIVSKPNARPQSVLQLRENKHAQEVRSQYEVKLKRLVAENTELKKKQTQSTQSIQTARAKAEGMIGRLRADIEALKLDKKQLNKGMKLESDKARETISNYEREIQQYKRKELIAADAKKKLEELNETQAQALKKRTDETAFANNQLRQLTNALRRAATEGTFLNEAALEKILAESNGTPTGTLASSTSPKNGIRR